MTVKREYQIITFIWCPVLLWQLWCFMNCINKSLDSFRTHVGIIYIPCPRFAMYLSLRNLSTIVTGLLVIDLILSIGPHKKESEEREFRIHFEGMRRGGADRRETVDEEMKEKERDITSDRAQESKFPWSVISFLLLVTKSYTVFSHHILKICTERKIQVFTWGLHKWYSCISYTEKS